MTRNSAPGWFYKINELIVAWLHDFPPYKHCFLFKGFQSSQLLFHCLILHDKLPFPGLFMKQSITMAQQNYWKYWEGKSSLCYWQRLALDGIYSRMIQFNDSLNSTTPSPKQENLNHSLELKQDLTYGRVQELLDENTLGDKCLPFVWFSMQTPPPMPQEHSVETQVQLFPQRHC